MIQFQKGIHLDNLYVKICFLNIKVKVLSFFTFTLFKIIKEHNLRITSCRLLCYYSFFLPLLFLGGREKRGGNFLYIRWQILINKLQITLKCIAYRCSLMRRAKFTVNSWKIYDKTLNNVQTDLKLEMQVFRENQQSICRASFSKLHNSSCFFSPKHDDYPKICSKFE